MLCRSCFALIGAKIEHKVFFVSQTFRAPPGYPGKRPGISCQKVCFPWASKDIPKHFGPPPLHIEDPHPTKKISGPKSLSFPDPTFLSLVFGGFPCFFPFAIFLAFHAGQPAKSLEKKERGIRVDAQNRNRSDLKSQWDSTMCKLGAL